MRFITLVIEDGDLLDDIGAEDYIRDSVQICLEEEGMEVGTISTYPAEEEIANVIIEEVAYRIDDNRPISERLEEYMQKLQDEVMEKIGKMNL